MWDMNPQTLAARSKVFQFRWCIVRLRKVDSNITSLYISISFIHFLFLAYKSSSSGFPIYWWWLKFELKNVYWLVTVYVYKICHNLCHHLCQHLKHGSVIAHYGIVEINLVHKMISFLVIILILQFFMLHL